MATQTSIVDYILDQLDSVAEVKVKKMFGEYALYASGKVVALICDNTLLLAPSLFRYLLALRGLLGGSFLCRGLADGSLGAGRDLAPVGAKFLAQL